MNCLFLQNSGIGDICVLSKAAHHFNSLGYNVIWPILPQLLFLKEYLITPANIIDVNDSSISNYKIEKSIDFQNADRFFSGNTLLAKYKSIDLDWSDWSSFLKFKRNREKESELFKNYFGLTDSSRYNLINRNYGTPPNYKVNQNVKAPNNGLDNIYMDFVPNFTLFDWLKIIEKASNIYTIDTSFLFLMETMSVRSDSGELVIWPRDGHYNNIDGLFKKQYKKI